MKKIYYSVKDSLKRLFDRIRNEDLKQNLMLALPFWIASLFTGLIAVAYTKLFTWAEQGAHAIYTSYSWSFFLITPVCFFLAWWLVKRFAPFARGSGIPQVMASVDIISPANLNKVNKLLSLRVILIKIASSLVMVFGGGAIGREGPTIQIAGSIFRLVNKWLPSWWPKISKKNMILTGSAAGLAAAFNTPLGGIVFAVEELAKTHINYFKTALFTAVIIAGLTAQGLLGPYLYLGYPNVGDLSAYVFLLVILVALVSGVGGSLMARVIIKLLKWKSGFRFKHHHVFYVLACAFILVGIAYFFHPGIMGSGKDLMTETLFSDQKHLPAYSPFLRIAGPILSFTTGAAGGVFAPSLSAGASIGSVISGLFHLPDTESNLLILAGMVAFLTGVTRSPFTSAILVLEMTDRHSVIFHLMLAAMIASLVSYFIDKRSLYERLKEEYVKELG
ncbi:MAG: chloride channel protein [Chitinophagales bacterium]|nr:chloride channel protein [Chitinophagales bacterium]